MSNFQFETTQNAADAAAQERRRAARAALGLAATALESARNLLTDPHERALVDECLGLVAALEPMRREKDETTPRQ